MSSSGLQRRCSSGAWTELLPRVYVARAAPRTWEQRCAAVLLWAGDGAALSGLTAAALLQIHPSLSRAVEVTTARSLKAPQGWIVVHRATLARSDVEKRRGMAVTTASKTLLDIAGRLGEQALEEAVDEALRRRLTTTSRLRWQLDREGGKGRPGSGRLRHLVDRRLGDRVIPESVLETRMTRLMGSAGLPAPIRQYEIRSRGHVVGRVDFAFPAARLAIEVDGFRYHGGRAAWRRDLARGNDLLALGWRVLRFTWEDVTAEPGRVTAAISAALSSG